MKGKLMGLVLIGLMAFSFANELSNPGFETDSFVVAATPFATTIKTNVWGLTSYASRSNAQHYDGSYSMKIGYPNGVTNKGFEQIVDITNCYDVANATIMAKKSGLDPDGQYTLYLRFLDSSKALISTYTNTFSLTTTWTYKFVSHTIPDGTTYAQVIVAGGSGEHNGFFDAAELVCN
jgi:hypothetical protein